SFGEFSFRVFTAKNQEFGQVAIEQGVEPSVIVSRSQFHPIDERAEYFGGFLSDRGIVQASSSRCSFSAYASASRGWSRMVAAGFSTCRAWNSAASSQTPQLR